MAERIFGSGTEMSDYATSFGGGRARVGMKRLQRKRLQSELDTPGGERVRQKMRKLYMDRKRFKMRSKTIDN